MYIRITKNLKKADAARLREARKKIDFFSQYANSNFLFEEFLKNRKEEELFTHLEEEDINTFEVHEDIGPFTFPKYLFSEVLHKLQFEPNWDSAHCYEKVFCDIVFATAKKDNSGKAFRLGVFAEWDPDTHNRKFDLSILDNLEPHLNIVFNIPLCFYDKKELYRKIFKLLRKNKEKLIKISKNKEFIEDIISLFSVKNSGKEPGAFDLSDNSKEKEFIIHDKGSIGIYNEEGTSKELSELSYFENMHRIESEIKGIEEVHARLGKNKDILITDFIFGHMSMEFLAAFGTVGDANINEIKNNKKLDDFLTLYLNDWLKNYVALADFTAEVFDKVKTKILITSINT
jgi:hypothetical protein